MAKKTQSTKAASTKAAKTKATKGTKGTTKKGSNGRAHEPAAATAVAAPGTGGKRKPPTKTLASGATEKPKAAQVGVAAVVAGDPAAHANETATATAAETHETTTAAEAAEVPPVGERASGAHEPKAAPLALPLGTVLRRVDRHGNVRCECVAVEGGFRFDGTVYKSLSAAALAAAKSLGLNSPSVNGPLFWGLSKPARAAANPLALLERVWGRYSAALERSLERREHREAVLAGLERHVRVLQNLRDEAAREGA
ncbi:MAG: hypothetical protein M9894_33090 [Planctomycetes bacterium]|nr:hypothetical protein [Planctomycetota bacterium]